MYLFFSSFCTDIEQKSRRQGVGGDKVIIIIVVFFFLFLFFTILEYNHFHNSDNRMAPR